MSGASGKRAASRWALGIGIVVVLAVQLALLASSCADNGDFPPVSSGGVITSTAGSGPSGGGGSCMPEQARQPCHVNLGTHDGITDCLDGYQECLGGQWSACIDGTLTHRAPKPRTGIVEIPVETTAEELAALPMLLTVDAGACPNNPCDPSCSQIVDVMPTGGVPVVSDAGLWAVATGVTIPGTLGVAGRPLASPSPPTSPPAQCGSSWDCEDDMFCSRPVTFPLSATTCYHDKCGVGYPLLATTCGDECASAVLAADAHCNAICVAAHSPCATGGPLSSVGTPAGNCIDSCISNVCNVQGMTSCCSGTWDNTCVTAYQTCRQTVQPAFSCAAATSVTWDAQCMQDVHDFCGVTCPPNNSPGCTHDICITGQTLNAGCDVETGPVASCTAALCATPGLGYCCNSAFPNQWDQNCVNNVENVCGVTCPSYQQQGVCLPWQPNVVDPQCAGPDLTLGVPCTNQVGASVFPGQQIIAMCNVGTQPTPMGQTIVVNKYQAGSSNMPRYPPSGTASTTGATCSTTQQILPGKCINIFCPTANHDELYINPGGVIPECNYRNNWASDLSTSTFKVQCDAPKCSLSASSINNLQPHMFIEVDVSNAASASFSTIQSGLKSFFTDTTENASAMQTKIATGQFPLAGNCDQATCGAFGAMTCVNGNPPTNSSSAPTVKITRLNATNATNVFVPWANGASCGTGCNPLAQAAAAVGPAPYAAALQQAINAAATDFQYWTTQPNPPGPPYPMVVLILGSEPTASTPAMSCNSTLANLMGIAGAGYAGIGNVRTSVIYMGSATAATAQAIASAGHGLALAATNVYAELKTIRKAAYPCSVGLPPAGLFDPTGTTVTNFDTGNPVGSTVATQVQNLAGCAALGSTAGWYYDSNTNPTQMILCPSTCSTWSDFTVMVGGQAKYNTNSATNYHVACPAYYPPTPAASTTYQGMCPIEGTAVEWRYFSYDTTLPAGTSVQFQVQTTSKFAPSMPVTVATAGNPDPAQCLLGGPAGCPKDLVAILNGTSANGPAIAPSIQVLATLNGNSNKSAAPTVNSWLLWYSCPYVQ